ISRRRWVESLCGGLGSIGLAGMLARDAQAAPPARAQFPNFPPKAKHVIVLFMAGGPSQLDMFDPKPSLAKHAGERPASVGLGTENANLPGFVVLSPDPGYSYLWRSGFLPSEHQGTYFNDAESEPEKMIRYLRNTHMSATEQRRQLDFIQALNRRHEASFGKE